jgi:hypothetical protein
MTGFEVLADKVMYFKNALKDPEGWLKAIDSAKTPFISNWALWEKDTYEDGSNYMKKYGYKKIIHGKQLLMAKRDQYPNDAFQHIVELILAIDECVNIYKSIYDVTLERKYNKNNFVLTKYENEGKADLQHHIDIDGDWEEYSIIIYLNDNYKGGELELPNFNVKVKPEAGSIFIFPSGDPYEHVAHKSYDGQKYFISHFWNAGAGSGYVELVDRK